MLLDGDNKLFGIVFFWVGKLWSLVVIPCVLSWDTVFPFLDWVLLKEFQGFFLFLCFGLLLQGWPYQHAVGIFRLARGGGSRCGNLFFFYVWEFALSVWLGFVVGVCHVIF